MTTRKQQLEHLAKLMEKIDIAMLTTVGQSGYLVSRPLSTQAASFDGERVWFFTEADSPKVAEIRRHPKINVAYSSKDANTYLSAAGDARINRDQALIDRFWNDALKAFFPKGPHDPNLVLIEVALRTVEYWDGPGTWIGKPVTFAIARVTGNDDVMAENRIVDVATGRSRKPPGSDRPGRSGRSAAAKRATGRTTKAGKSAKSATTAKTTKTAKTARKSTPRKPGARTAAKKKSAAKGVVRKS
jgi:general stress protein 26